MSFPFVAQFWPPFASCPFLLLQLVASCAVVLVLLPWAFTSIAHTVAANTLAISHHEASWGGGELVASPKKAAPPDVALVKGPGGLKVLGLMMWLKAAHNLSTAPELSAWLKTASSSHNAALKITVLLESSSSWPLLFSHFGHTTGNKKTTREPSFRARPLGRRRHIASFGRSSHLLWLPYTIWLFNHISIFVYNDYVMDYIYLFCVPLSKGSAKISSISVWEFRVIFPVLLLGLLVACFVVFALMLVLVLVGCWLAERILRLSAWSFHRCATQPKLLGLPLNPFEMANSFQKDLWYLSTTYTLTKAPHVALINWSVDSLFKSWPHTLSPTVASNKCWGFLASSLQSPSWTRRSMCGGTSAKHFSILFTDIWLKNGLLT